MIISLGKEIEVKKFREISMGRVGLEPTRHHCRRILSPLRLPIPPPPRVREKYFTSKPQSFKTERKINRVSSKDSAAQARSARWL